MLVPLKTENFTFEIDAFFHNELKNLLQEYERKNELKIVILEEKSDDLKISIAGGSDIVANSVKLFKTWKLVKEEFSLESKQLGHLQAYNLIEFQKEWGIQIDIIQGIFFCIIKLNMFFLKDKYQIKGLSKLNLLNSNEAIKLLVIYFFF